MELTITQNGALYAVQHGAIKKYRGAGTKRVIATKGDPGRQTAAGDRWGIGRFKWRNTKASPILVINVAAG